MKIHRIFVLLIALVATTSSAFANGIAATTVVRCNITNGWILLETGKTVLGDKKITFMNLGDNDLFARLEDGSVFHMVNVPCIGTNNEKALDEILEHNIKTIDE